MVSMTRYSLWSTLVYANPLPDCWQASQGYRSRSCMIGVEPGARPPVVAARSQDVAEPVNWWQDESDPDGKPQWMDRETLRSRL